MSENYKKNAEDAELDRLARERHAGEDAVMVFCSLAGGLWVGMNRGPVMGILMGVWLFTIFFYREILASLKERIKLFRKR